MTKVYEWVFLWGSLFLTTFLSFLPAVDAVYCYTCTSKDKKTCGYTFMIDKDDQENVQWCPTSCYKLSTTRSDHTAVSRGCLPEMKTIDWCRHDRKRDVKGVMCTCNTDFCNGSSTSRAFYISVFSCVAILIVKIVIVAC